jgi:hypothetical protein
VDVAALVPALGRPEPAIKQLLAQYDLHGLAAGWEGPASLSRPSFIRTTLLTDLGPLAKQLAPMLKPKPLAEGIVDDRTNMFLVVGPQLRVFFSLTNC